MARIPDFPKPPRVAERPIIVSVRTADHAVMCGWLECRGRIAFGIAMLPVSGTEIPVCERCDDKFSTGALPVRFVIEK